MDARSEFTVQEAITDLEDYPPVSSLRSTCCPAEVAPGCRSRDVPSCPVQSADQRDAVVLSLVGSVCEVLWLWRSATKNTSKMSFY